MPPKQRRQRAGRCRALLIIVCILFTAGSLLYRGELRSHGQLGTAHTGSARPITTKKDYELAGKYAVSADETHVLLQVRSCEPRPECASMAQPAAWGWLIFLSAPRLQAPSTSRYPATGELSLWTHLCFTGLSTLLAPAGQAAAGWQRYSLPFCSTDCSLSG